jgi:molecular chaperone HtpG
MKGVVESGDLSLNVSREMLQQDLHVRAIRKQVINKSVKHLKGLLSDEREGYEEIWGNFGEVLKESVVDYEFADKVKPLLLFKSSTQEGLTTLDEYIERMAEGQEAIYYLVGESLEGIKRSPHLEAFSDKGVEVLFLDQPIDEYLVENLNNYEGKKLSSVAQGDVDLSSEEEREEAEKELKESTEASQGLLDALKGDLGEHIKEVRLSQRLTSSPACLVADEGAMSPQMIRMMEQMGQTVPKSKRILELNPKHPLFERLKAEFSSVEGEATSPRMKHFAQIIYGQALIAEGSALSDPAAFTEALTQVMVEA